MRAAFAVLAVISLTFSPALAGPRDVNHIANPGFESVADGQAVGWSPYGEGYEIVREGRDGGSCMKCHSETGDVVLGAGQDIYFDPPIQHPFLISGWSKSEDAGGYDYCVWLDVHYADGTPLWGQKAYFQRGTHDWAYAEQIFTPLKPVAHIQAFVLFRRMKGAAWFDDIRVSLAPLDFTRTTVLGGFAGEGRVEALGSVTLPSVWRTEIRADDRVVFAQEGKGLSQRISWDGRDRAGKPVQPGECTVSFRATDTLMGETIEESRVVDTRGVQPGRNYALWTESSMKRVMPVDLPENADTPTTLELAAARNEYESGQIVLMPGADTTLHNVRATASDLTGPDGVRIEAENVRWEQVGYVWVENQRLQPYMPQYAPTWWPDPLLPVESFEVEPGWAQPIWVTVYVPEGTPPGEYIGAITVTADNNSPTVVPVWLTVYDFTVPTRGHLKTAFALMQGYLEKIYGAENVTPDLRQAYGDYLLAHHLNPGDISRTEPPVIDDIAHYQERGLNAFNVLNLVEPRGDRTWRCWSPLEAYTPQLKRQIIASLDPYVAELKARGLAQGAYIYTFDERGADFFPVMREYFGMVKQRYGLPTLTTAKVPQDPAVMRDLNVDWNCPLTPAYSFDDAERCRATGLEVWAYVCLGPRYPYANFLADDPLIEARVIWWQAFQQKMDGFLYWGVNIWRKQNNDRPIDLREGAKLTWSINTRGREWLQGDGVLIYALQEGPAGSIRLENIRDGLEDYEYLWALGEKRGDVWTARADCAPVTESLTVFTRDPRMILRARDSIARELTE